MARRCQQEMRTEAIGTTVACWLLGICLLLGAAACTSSRGSNTANPSSSASTTYTPRGCFSGVVSGNAGAYVGLSLNGAEARAKSNHDRLIVVEEAGTCTVRAMPGYNGPSLTVEVALVDGKVADARSIDAESS